MAENISQYETKSNTLMQKLYGIKLCESDWKRVIQALRNEAYQVTQESQRACEKGAVDYGTLLWEETLILSSIADTIDFLLPE